MFIISNFTRPEIYMLIYLFSINLTSFLIYGFDKLKAKRGTWRIAEITLFLLGFLGGAIGSLMAMVIFKHKLSKKRFTIGIPIIIIINIIGLILFINIMK